jgi:hypothetical protein
MCLYVKGCGGRGYSEGFRETLDSVIAYESDSNVGVLEDVGNFLICGDE